MRNIISPLILACVLLGGVAHADPKPKSPGELRISMRQRWDDQHVFTRNFIISTLAMDGDQVLVTEYFLAHQSAIAEVLEPYYGAAASQRVAELLRAHGLVTVDLMRAIGEGNALTSAQLSRLHAHWVGSANELAAYLASLNPRWDRAQLRRSLETYLDLTMDQVAGRAMRNWDVEFTAYERVCDHTNRLADFLSNGIVRQFPQKFR